MHPTSNPTHIPFIPSESNLPSPNYSNFNILPWKSKVKVMGKVKVWSHNVSLTFYQLTSLSFHVNRPFHSSDTNISKFDLENPRSRSRKRWTLKVTTWVQHSIDSHPFSSMSIGHTIHKIRFFFLIWPWKSKVKIMGEGKVDSHNMGPTFYRLTSLSFHVNRPSHSWDTTFWKFDL